jgi:hypothetical protein
MDDRPTCEHPTNNLGDQYQGTVFLKGLIKFYLMIVISN